MRRLSLSRSTLIRAGMGTGVIGLLLMGLLQLPRDHLPVDVTPVTTGAIRMKIGVSGVIEPVLSVQITASQSGRVVEIPVGEGQMVREGDVLLRLDPAKADAGVRRADAELASSEAEARAAQATLSLSEEKAGRMERMAAKQLVAIEELQNATNQVQIHAAQYAAARERAQQSRAALDAAHEEVAQTVIRASINGTVTDVGVEVGEMVTGSAYGTGALLMRLIDLSRMRLAATVDETEIPIVRIDQAVDVRVEALGDTLFVGRVIRVARTAVEGGARDGEPVLFPVDIALVNPPEALRPGMSAQGNIVVEERAGVLTIPLQALVSRRDGTAVYRLQETEVQQIRVTTGLSDELCVEIKDGLKPGELIVVGSARALRVLKDRDQVAPTVVSAAQVTPSLSLR